MSELVIKPGVVEATFYPAKRKEAEKTVAYSYPVGS